MAKDDGLTITPRLRFPEFRKPWTEKVLGDYLVESRIPGSDGLTARKLTVRLWGKGVHEKVEATKGSENTRYYKRSAGQLIYSKLDFLNQAFGIIPRHLDGFESTVDLPCFDIIAGLDARFILEYVQRPNFYKKYGEMADGGRKAKRIQVESFLSFPIVVPSLTEQRKIAACLESLDDWIEAETTKLETMRLHKKGLMQQLFPEEGDTHPRLRFPEFRKRGEGEFLPIGQFAQVTTGNKDTQDKVDGGKYPFFVRSQNLERIDSFSFDGEAVLTSGDGVGVGENYHYINGRFDYHQRVYCIYNFAANVSGEFFFHFFSTHFKKRVRALSAKNSVDSVRMAMITEMPVWLPKPAEQKRIAACLSELDSAVVAQSRKVEALGEHKKGLMQQLFPTREG